MYETNYSDVEKLLLNKPNVQMAVRFVLNRGFFMRNPESMLILDKIRQSCLTVIDTLSAQRDRRDLVYDDLDNELDVDGPTFPSSHRRCTIISHIPKKQLNESHQINGFTGGLIGPLPLRQDQMSLNFQQQLSRAYGRAYNEPPIIDFRKKPLQWATKFAFTA